MLDLELAKLCGILPLGDGITALISILQLAMG